MCSRPIADIPSVVHPPCMKWCSTTLSLLGDGRRERVRPSSDPASRHAKSILGQSRQVETLEALYADGHRRRGCGRRDRGGLCGRARRLS